jgi:hypothetical protein
MATIATDGIMTAGEWKTGIKMIKFALYRILLFLLILFKTRKDSRLLCGPGDKITRENTFLGTRYITDPGVLISLPYFTERLIGRTLVFKKPHAQAVPAFAFIFKRHAVELMSLEYF